MSTAHTDGRPASDALVSFEGVAKDFDGVQALRSIDLDVRRGEFVAVLGPSGCGKTTLLRLLAGLEAPSRGRILLDGADLAGIDAAKRRTPMVWQNYALFPFMTVRQNIEFALKAARFARREIKPRAESYMERLGIDRLADREIDQISGGQRQRVALARALVQEPEILLLDEPLSALDAHLRVRMQNELKKMHLELGITFFYVTHYQSEALSMADRIVVMDNGRIVQVDTPMEVYRRPRTRYVAEFIGSNNVLPASVVERDGSGLLLDVLGQRMAVDDERGLGARPGDLVEVVIGADRVAPVAVGDGAGAGRGDDADFVFGGTVEGKSFTGNSITVHARTADGTLLRAEAAAASVDFDALTLGSPIELRGNSRHVVLLEPDEG